jgi:AcrR family transcriptional regulator
LKEKEVTTGNKKRLRPSRRTGPHPPARKNREGAGTPLQRELIVSTALAIVDRDGLKSLSMRRLGDELGVDPMAVYYYLPNKQALLDAIVEAVMASIDLSVDDPARPPEQRLLGAAHAYRDALLAHAMRPVELLIGILRDAGLPPAKALAGMNVIAGTVRGAVGMGPVHEPTKEELEAMWRALPANEFPRLAEAFGSSGLSFEQIFDFGMRALTRGLLVEAESHKRP